MGIRRRKTRKKYKRKIRKTRKKYKRKIRKTRKRRMRHKPLRKTRRRRKRMRSYRGGLPGDIYQINVDTSGKGPQGQVVTLLRGTLVKREESKEAQRADLNAPIKFKVTVVPHQREIAAELDVLALSEEDTNALEERVAATTPLLVNAHNLTFISLGSKLSLQQPDGGPSINDALRQQHETAVSEARDHAFRREEALHKEILRTPGGALLRKALDLRRGGRRSEYDQNRDIYFFLDDLLMEGRVTEARAIEIYERIINWPARKFFTRSGNQR